ncbi:MAG: sensor domain-containing diguanylate cyclase [Janthinobacterium lividum]
MRSGVGAFRALVGEIWQGCWQRSTWPRVAVVRLLLVFTVVCFCSWLGIVLSRQSDGVATIWLSNGLLFGLLITQPKRRWLLYFAAGLTADTLADMMYGDMFRVAFGVSVANSVEVVLSTLVLSLWFGAPLDLTKRRPLVGFLLSSVVVATAITSALGASWTLLFFDAGPWWTMFRTWYLGDMLGMAVLAPVIVILQRPAVFAILQRKTLPRTLLVLSVPLLTTVLVFTHNQDPLLFFLFPALLLVAFCLGFPGTVLNILMVMVLAIGFTVKGHGPLMLIAGEHMLLHRIVIAQIFVAVAIFTMFPVAALLEEKEALKVSLAASEARFRTLAHADELTGLSNRRAFNLQLEEAWERGFAEGEPLALLLLDADLFKQYNDTHGHVGGDECLRSLANVMACSVEEAAGLAARFGGEEFAAILPRTALERALEVAECVRAAVVNRQLLHPHAPSGVQTVSIGVASLVPGPGQNAAELVTLADRALYTAKRRGRNQVAFH